MEQFSLNTLDVVIMFVYAVLIIGYGLYKAKRKNSEELYKSYEQWRTHQMSDHLPLWVEARIDYSDEYLEDKLEKSMQY